MLRIPSPALPLAGALLIISACGPAPIPPPSAPVAAAASVASVAPAPQPPAPITAGAMPGDVQLYAELSGVPALLASARAVVGAAPLAELRASVAHELGIEGAAGDRLIDAVESLHFGGHRAGNDMKVGVSVVFSDPQPVRDLLASGRLVDHGSVGPYGRRLTSHEGSKDPLVWFDGPRLLVTGDEPMLEAIASVVEGRAPALTDAQRGATPGERHPVLAFVAPSLLDALAQGQVSFAAPLSIAYTGWEGGYRGAFRTAIASSLGAHGIPFPPPRPLTLARLLPAETASYLALSTGIPGGRQGAGLLLAQVLALTGRDGDHTLSTIDGALAVTGVRLADLVGGLGDEGVLAVSVRPGVKSESELENGFAVILVQELADGKPAEQLLKAARDKLSSPKKARVHAEGAGFSAELIDAAVPFLRARIQGGRLVVAVGQRDLVDRAFAAVDKGKGRLADDGAHTHALAGMPPSSALRVWIDLGRALELGAASAPPAQRATLDALRGSPQSPDRPTSALSFTATPEGDRIRLDLDEVNGISVYAALGIYGVRRYLALAKSAEARNTVGAITRAAVAAYEREQLGPGTAVVHSLCRTAQPVPSAVPRRVKYQSATQPGTDWQTGDATTGWRCLKFAMTTPQYFRYSYSAGGPYKGPARGGPDPGPNGFEVAAEGDLDGNGVTSLYTRIGTVDPTTGQVSLSTSLFVSNEGE